MTDAREQVIAGLEAAIRDPHCPLQYSPLLMQAQKLLRAIAPPEPTEGLRAHKIMTSQEYRDLNLKGWHMVCRDYDGPRSVGIRYTGDQTGSMPLQDHGSPMETAPKNGEVLIQVERRAGIPNCFLVGHYQPGGHCIDDHPAIDEGWYFWNGCMFDRAAKPLRWWPLPAMVAEEGTK